MASAQDPTPLSDTLTLDAHTLTYSIGGVEPVPDDPVYEGYDGIIRTGGTITFSGSTSFSIGGLANCTGLRMTANMGGWGIESQNQTWTSPQEATPEHNFCDGQTSWDFTLTAEVPDLPEEELLPPTDGPAEPIGSIYGASENVACGVGGVCGGVSMDFSIAVVPGVAAEGFDFVTTIGALGAAALAGLAVSHGGQRPTARRYVLQVSSDHLQVMPDMPATLSAQVWEVDADGRSSPAAATITLTTSPPLTVTPATGTGAIEAVVALTGAPAAASAAVTVTAQVEQSTQQQVVSVAMAGEYRLQIT